jgi:hypothetical protein
MAPNPKIYTNKQVELLRKFYIDNKMSTTDISSKSKDIFGMDISVGTIYKSLISNHIPVRNKSESVSMAVSTLNIDETYMTEEILEWLDGFLLGDGGINFNNRENFMGSRLHIGSSELEWAKYAMTKFNAYGTTEPKESGIIDEKHPNKTWSSRTLTHPDIVNQAKRWYSGINQSKKVPTDVRITPTSILLWYLGDGSVTYGIDSNTYIVRFATCAFLIEDIEKILMPKLQALGIECLREQSKNDIRIRSHSIGRFFDIIGHKSPIACYDHRFKIPEWARLIRLSDIVTNDRQKWMAHYYCKTGQVECTKSPGGRMLLFTEEQANQLKQKLAAT